VRIETIDRKLFREIAHLVKEFPRIFGRHYESRGFELLYNRSDNEKEESDDWTTSILVHFYKKDRTQCYENYRTLSLISHANNISFDERTAADMKHSTDSKSHDFKKIITEVMKSHDISTKTRKSRDI
jgi:hypothetical protein